MVKDKFKKLFSVFKKNRKIQIITAAVLVGVIGVVVIKIVIGAVSNEETYRETTVAKGNLTVGVSESGTIDIGTVEQTFDLDMSALERVKTSNSNSSGSSNSSGMPGGMGGMGGNSGNSGGSSNNMFSQMFNMGGNTTTTGSSNSSSLVIDSVEISVGQEIKEGDVILVLESEGVDELKTELEDNVEKATADLEALEADQKLSRITAEYTLQTSLKYGDYAGKELDATVSELAQDITDAKETLAAAQNSLTRYEEQLTTAKSDLENAKVVTNNAIWVRDNINKNDNLYDYCNAFNVAETAISNQETLENKVEQLEEKVETAKKNVERSKQNVNKAQRNYDSGKISAQETYDLKMLAYETAQETYDITISYLEDALSEQKENYEETQDKWNEFTSYIDGLNVVSKYSGLVTSLDLKSGDSLDTGTVVLTLYDSDDITMTVSLDEDDMADIAIGGLANITMTAYPDEVFEAVITEIGDASTDKSGNVTYDVTVNLNADVNKLFQGMTADVKFITKQTSEVLYINNRAIIRENGVSYVKVKDDKGNISKVKVTTGFSDGVNVEIIDGLEEGQTVIIEKGDN